MLRNFIHIVGLILLLSSCTHRFDGVEDNTPVGNMECLWKTLDDKYCFFEEKGIDWQDIHNQYLPAVQQLKGSDYLGLFDTLASMINVLNDGHVNLYSPFDISTCKTWYENDSVNFDWDVIKKDYLRDYRTAGGAYYNTLGNGSVGYVYISDFETPISANNMFYILKYFSHCSGLIIDVRNNGGGNMDYAYQLAASFFEGSQTVGYWQHKNGRGHESFSSLKEQRLDKNIMPSTWLRPVVVLCNRKTYSAANFFVSIMRYAHNTHIVGGRSGGGGGMPMSYELPNGWMLRFSSIRMFDKDKKSIEPGIEPNEWVNDNSLTQQDEIIEAGIRWINKQ
ncbi:MAG: S41 family peptidase [Paludibacteraceae bacterium]|nr:S41 family peptidase [Paludibacteraceae bacterium]